MKDTSVKDNKDTKKIELELEHVKETVVVMLKLMRKEVEDLRKQMSEMRHEIYNLKHSSYR